MPSLSEILNSKAESKQQRTESRRAEREQLSQMRDASLMAITTTPDCYTQYLVLQGDNIGLSAGNIALALSQMVNPTKIGTTDFWHKQGRYVMDEEMNKGASVFVPPRDRSFRGYLMGSYYDVSQTTGRPLKESVPLAEGSERMNTAFAALLDTAPVGFVENTKLDAPARYNERNCVLEINTEYSAGQVFAALATEISYARIHDRGMNRDYDRESFQLTAESIGFMVCRRFGVDCPVPDTAGVEKFYGYYAPDERGKSLDLMRQTARNMGDTVERSIQPRHLDYFAVSAEMSEDYQPALEFIRPAVEQANGMASDREKVKYLNDYLCSLMSYDRKAIAGVSRVFTQHSSEIAGACGDYAHNFKFLCGAAGIPCITISTASHSWNLVYADGQWLHVDVSANDLYRQDYILLTRTVSGRTDTAPAATEFLKELARHILPDAAHCNGIGISPGLPG